VAVVRNKIVSLGRNRYVGRNDRTIHAEVDCLLGRDRRSYAGSEVYIAGYRIGRKDGELIKELCNRPCEACMNLLVLYEVRRVVYTTEDGDIVRESI